MPTPIATGSISIIDYQDAPTLSAFISVAGSKTQIYDPATGALTPDWTISSPILTPTLFVSTKGNVDQIGSAQIRSVTWYDSAAPNTPLTSTGAYTITGNTLKISQNVMTDVSPSKTYIVQIVWRDPNTGDDLTIRADIPFSRISNGATGPAAITAVLSNDAHTVPTDSAGNNGAYGGASTVMSVYIGANDDSANWTVTANTPAGVTGSLGTGATARTYTVTNMTVDSAAITLTASKPGYPSISKVFTISKNKQGVTGSTGASATSYWLVPSVAAIQKNISGVYTPANISVDMRSQSGTGTPAFYGGRLIIAETTDGTTWTDKYTSSANETGAKSYTPTAGIKALRVRMYLAGGVTTLLDEQIIAVVSDGATGAPAVTGVLSNESAVVPADLNGNVTSWGGASTTMSVYVGSTDDTANWTFTQSLSGVTGAASGTPANRTFTASGGMAPGTDTATVTITATKSGQPSISKVFTITKSKTGATGASAVSYWLVPSVSAIQKNIAGAYTPATFTVTGKTQTGSGTPTDYSTKFIIAETTDGSTWTDKYTSASNETSKTWTPTAGIKALRVRMYQAGVTPSGTNHIDEQIITVVSDGATGAPAVVLTAETPSGNVFKNDIYSSLTAVARLYVGATEQTSGVTWEWFIQKTGNADEGVGAGWQKITTTNQAANGVTGAVNTSSIVITSDSVLNITPFRVKATYSGKSYIESIVFIDQTDPILVTVESSNGDKFKNGDVQTTLTCILSQNGTEIDPVKTAGDVTPYKYTYTWYKYNADGSQDMNFGGAGVSSKTGKKIDVNPADVQGKAVFRVEIS